MDILVFQLGQGLLINLSYGSEWHLPFWHRTVADLMLFLLNNLRYFWCHGKCLSMTGRNILLMFVFTLTQLYGTFNPMIFLLRVLLGGVLTWIQYFHEATNCKCIIMCGCSFIEVFFTTRHIRSSPTHLWWYLLGDSRWVVWLFINAE